jgi:hypothetical protein
MGTDGLKEILKLCNFFDTMSGAARWERQATAKDNSVGLLSFLSFFPHLIASEIFAPFL